MSRTKLFIGGAFVAAALLAGGTAFTASNDINAVNHEFGYGSVTADNVNIASIDYTVVGADVTSVTLKIVDASIDQAASGVEIGFNLGARADCGAGVVEGLNVVYTCDTSGLAASVAETITSTEVVVGDLG